MNTITTISQIQEFNKITFKQNSVNTKNRIITVNKPSTENIRENKSLSKGVKILLGIGGTGATIYGILVAHRAVSRPSMKAIQKDLSKIFRRSVSLDEIPQMIKEYRNLLKIKDPTEFCEKAFQQVKKDYGYKNINLKLTLSEDTNTDLGGCWIDTGEAFIIYYKNLIKHSGGDFNNKLTKAKILNNIFHEFQHVKQTEYCVRTNMDKYINESIGSETKLNKRFINSMENVLANPNLIKTQAALFNISEEEYKRLAREELRILKEKGYKGLPICLEQVNKELQKCRQRFNELFGKYEKFKTGTKEYNDGEKYIDNFIHYTETSQENFNEYKNQLLEKEAFNAENGSKIILERQKSIWNIFDNTNYIKQER